MNLKTLQEKQRLLDECIVKTHAIEERGGMLHDLAFALHVEIAELANATRFFKFWSIKKPEREQVLDEAADVLHFILSIANHTEVDTSILSWSDVEEERRSGGCSLRQTFRDAMRQASDLQETCEWSMKASLPHAAVGVQLLYTLRTFIHLLLLLEISDAEITAAYLKKHEVNYQRQASGY